MKVLWFTNTTSLYTKGKANNFAGGWIESLEQLIKEEKEIDLAISFFHPSDDEKVVLKRTTYYPIYRPNARKNIFSSIIQNYKGNLIDEDKYLPKLLQIINDFNPDIINVFGTESIFAKIQELTQVPVVIHLQGIMNPYFNAYFPPNHSRASYLISNIFVLKNILGMSPVFTSKAFKIQATKEKRFLKNASFLMGRTCWDKNISKLYNPNCTYFQINEVLRPQFYKSKKKEWSKKSDQLKIISTISSTPYKGIDLVLKTAKVLKELTTIDFHWQIIGLSPNDTMVKYFEYAEKIKHKDVGLSFLGRKSPEKLIGIIHDSDVFIHPSYIDNSPNSVCEAQMIGLPVIACNVGGLSSLIQHNVTGFLVPSNGVFEIVYYIKYLIEDRSQLMKIGAAARDIAIARHNREKILSNIVDTYNLIIRQ